MITVSFSETELQQLVNLIDAGVRATGLQAVLSAAALLQKLDDAVKASKESNVIPMQKEA